MWKGPERNKKTFLNWFSLVWTEYIHLLAFQNVSVQSVVGNSLVRINVGGGWYAACQFCFYNALRQFLWSKNCIRVPRAIFVWQFLVYSSSSNFAFFSSRSEAMRPHGVSLLLLFFFRSEKNGLHLTLLKYRSKYWCFFSCNEGFLPLFCVSREKVSLFLCVNTNFVRSICQFRPHTIFPPISPLIVINPDK